MPGDWITHAAARSIDNYVRLCHAPHNIVGHIYNGILNHLRRQIVHTQICGVLQLMYCARVICVTPPTDEWNDSNSFYDGRTPSPRHVIAHRIERACERALTCTSPDPEPQNRRGLGLWGGFGYAANYHNSRT